MNNNNETSKKELNHDIIAVIIIIIAVASVVLLIVKNLPKDQETPLSENQTYQEKLAASDDDCSAFILEHFDEYPEQLISDYFLNKDLYRDFMLEYPEHKNDYQDMTFTAEELSGGAPILLQTDSRWAFENFYGEYIIWNGCMPTTLTMAYIGFTGKADLDPKIITEMFIENGFGGISGFNIDCVKWFCDRYGFSCTEYDYRDDKAFIMPEKELVINALEKGHYFVVSCRVGVFTSSGHAVLLSGYDKATDTFRVNDPNSLERSQKSWSYEELAPELETIWEIGLD